MAADGRLFDPGEWWHDHWKGMPEFIQERREPFFELVVRFETEDDLRDFERRIGQEIRRTTKSIWHPKRPYGESMHLRYVDQGDDDGSDASGLRHQQGAE